MFDWSTVSGTVCPNGVLSLEYDSAHAQMGGDWRMPSKDDIYELLTFTTNEWIEDYEGSGVNGRVFTSKKNGNTMFIPAAGIWDGSSVLNQGDDADLWCALLSSVTIVARGLFFGSDDCNINYFCRCSGISVRGVI